MVLFDLAELQFDKGKAIFRWDTEAWFGGDIDRLVFKSEGEGGFGRAVEEAELQVLWSHAIGPYVNLQAGARYDFRPSPQRSYAVFGIEGLAPYWLEVEAHAFLSDQGDLLARFKAEHDMRITQRLILQPRFETNFSAQSNRAQGLGHGITDVELGLRLRYEIAREFAPYVGIAHEQRVGRTADYARLAGERRQATRFVAGVRAWF